MNNIEYTDDMILFYCDDYNKKTSSLWDKRFLSFELYELFWFLVFFSIIGFIIESGFSLVRNGYIESRRGLIFGPFTPIYGLGTIVLIFLLAPYKDKNIKLLFGSFFYGSVIEYVFSVLQEYLFNTRSWDYSSMPFNINGRICLLYSFYWAILGVIIIKYLYPSARFIISCIPRKEGEYFASILMVYLIYDSFISINAVIRANDRVSSIQPSNIFEKYIDINFNDQFLRKIYPHMEFNGKP